MNAADFDIVEDITCPACGGDGGVDGHRCYACKGTGTVPGFTGSCTMPDIDETIFKEKV
ncbi:MAG: hypothetical protein IMZ58_08475 [Thermoplasmata archaeon]|nr:hypothetical protein [Thermoplasmata archaeon]